MKKCPNCNHLVADDNVITCEKCGTYLEQLNSVEIIDEEQVQEENFLKEKILKLQLVIIMKWEFR